MGLAARIASARHSRQSRSGSLSHGHYPEYLVPSCGRCGRCGWMDALASLDFVTARSSLFNATTREHTLPRGGALRQPVSAQVNKLAPHRFPAKGLGQLPSRNMASKQAGPSLLQIPVRFSIVEPGVYRCASPTASQASQTCSLGSLSR